MFDFGGYNLLPSIQDIRENVEAEVTWGPWDLNRHYLVPALISGAARDAGNSTTTVLRPGLLVGMARAAGNYVVKEWTPNSAGAGTPDGYQYLAGVLVFDLSTQLQGANADRWGFILVGGNVKAKSLIVPGNASAGIDADAAEYNVRSLLAGRFMFDDMYHEYLVSGANGGYRAIINRTADLVLVEADHASMFTTLGAAGAVTFTLPAVTNNKGMRFMFFNAVDQNMAVASAAANQLITFNNAAASSVTFSTAGNKIGASVEIIGIGSSKWIVRPCGANTMTVA